MNAERVLGFHNVRWTLAIGARRRVRRVKARIFKLKRNWNEKFRTISDRTHFSRGQFFLSNLISLARFASAIEMQGARTSPNWRFQVFCCGWSRNFFFSPRSRWRNEIIKNWNLFATLLAWQWFQCNAASFRSEGVPLRVTRWECRWLFVKDFCVLC